MLERSAVKVASCVLMGEGDREVPDLPDSQMHRIYVQPGAQTFGMTGWKHLMGGSRPKRADARKKGMTQPR